ncbi:hypothetical protein Btru_055040 [Bulinus truncatus]|nr:hypothetical protein Btru_055040 [Bulinus truncatus]
MDSVEKMVFFVCTLSTYIGFVLSQEGTPYPITAAWFRDRTIQDLSRDLNFIWCGSYKESNPAWGVRCYDEAIQELEQMGLTVSSIVTYQYEENFSDDIMLCPQLDKKINSSRIYYRIVLPGKGTPYNSTDPCQYKLGSEVVLLFTSFAGTDPHELLLKEANKQGLYVYFGLPGIPSDFDSELMPAYYAWLERILHEHHSRYVNKTNFHSTGNKSSLYESLAGYYGTDESCLGEITPASPFIELYTRMGQNIKSYGKKFALSPYINLNKSQFNSTVSDHVRGFVTIAETNSVDIIAVQEGRGAAKGCYYWPQEINNSVSMLDPILDRAIHYLDPTMKPNITFAEAFSASNREVFSAFQMAQKMILNKSIKIDFWLNAEAFEYLRDDPCLPVDQMASGMGELLDRTSKERLDTAISVAGAMVQKIISFAWDSDYICKTEKYDTSLNEEIMQDLQRPIIANCSFRSYQNLSVVILGFNLDGETQAFTVEWTDTRGVKRKNNIHGYLFELNYGQEHNLVRSLQYVMLWDIPEMVTSLAPKGRVKVSAETARQSCYFEYDLPY